MNASRHIGATLKPLRHKGFRGFGEFIARSNLYHTTSSNAGGIYSTQLNSSFVGVVVVGWRS
jgi:hypothetical protein